MAASAAKGSVSGAVQQRVTSIPNAASSANAAWSQILSANATTTLPLAGVPSAKCRSSTSPTTESSNWNGRRLRRCFFSLSLYSSWRVFTRLPGKMTQADCGLAGLSPSAARRSSQLPRPSVAGMPSAPSQHQRKLSARLLPSSAVFTESTNCMDIICSNSLLKRVVVQSDRG